MTKKRNGKRKTLISWFWLHIATYYKNKRTASGNIHVCRLQSDINLRQSGSLYQSFSLLSSCRNILSVGFTPNASYHIDTCGRAPFTRHLPRE